MTRLWFNPIEGEAGPGSLQSAAQWTVISYILVLDMACLLHNLYVGGFYFCGWYACVCV